MRGKGWMGIAMTVGILALASGARADEPAGEAKPAEAEASPLLVESGAETFRRHCSACHGVSGAGDGPVAAVLRDKPADLTRIAARRDGRFPHAEIAAFIDGRTDVSAHGPREMPVWGRVFSKPIADGTTGEEVVRGQLLVLVEYLASLQVGN